MKKLIRFTFTLIILIGFSCSSDDNDRSDSRPTSGFIVSGIEYDTPNGYIMSSIDSENNSRHSIYLLNGTILNNRWYGQGCDYSNDLTHGVIFNIRSSSANELANGIYNYQLNTFQPSVNETSIATNLVVTGNCVTEASSINEDQIIGGSMRVERSGNIYTLTYTFETISFGVITGRYVGELRLAQDLS